MERAKRLTADLPLGLWVVLNEAVVRRVVGGPEVMRGQLGRLLDLAALRHVTVQTLPFSAGAHAAMQGTFTIMEFPEETHPEVVYLEAQTGGLYLEAAAELDRYSPVFDHLRAQALAPADSQGMITQAMKDVR